MRCRGITIGDSEFGYAKLAIRCAITLVDQRPLRQSSKPICGKCKARAQCTYE
ncbi:hypothetical protein OG203_42230 [Nocardia sp. NBC_01499]|uniref:hypothetical protein n=1 Tax=Nocardia sp. NBC_01499 TaxID=2903597 RepID=UPI00386E4D91